MKKTNTTLFEQFLSPIDKS